MIEAHGVRDALALRINRRLFFGWVMLAVAALMMFASGPAQSHTFSVFLLPIAEDLGLSRSSVSGAYAFATLVAALGLPFVGRAVDRHGVRRTTLVVAVLFGAAGVAFSGVGGFVALTIGFGGLRFLGQGSLMLNATNLVAQWFDRRRGLALSITMLGFSVSMALHPPLAQWLIVQVGWREAWVWLGVLTWVSLVPAIWLLVQDRPEAIGLRPDGAAAREPAVSSGAAGVDDGVLGLTASEALRTGAFWIVLASMSSLSMLVTGMFFHQVSIFEAQGLDAATAAGLFGVSALTMVACMPVIGHLLDRLPTRPMFIGALLSMSVALVAMSLVRDVATAVAFSVVFGFANAALQAHFGYVWPRYFGRRHLGSIQGNAQMGGVIGASIGPLPLGIAFDHFGGYGDALVVLAVLPVGCAFMVWMMRAPDLERTAGRGAA